MTAKKQASDAIDLLLEDHKQVRQLIKQYEKTHGNASADEKQELAAQICSEFLLHAEIEEQFFYPAAREALEEEDLINEAEVEHAGARDLVAQIQAMQPDDPLYDAKVKVLGEYIEHHVEEEEKELFPKVKKAKPDLASLGQEMLQAKETASTGFLAADSKRKGHGRSTRA
jgi:hemerythrin-like domain-containing protein